jgi:phage gp29-like protein
MVKKPLSASDAQKNALVTTSQGASRHAMLYSDAVRSQTRTLQDFAHVIAMLDIGYLYDYAQFCQYVLDNDGGIASICSTRRERCVSPKYEIAPPESAATDPDSILAAELCKKAIDGIEDWLQAKFSLTEAIIVGFSAHEIDWAYKGGLFLPRKIERRNPNRFIYSPTWELRLSDRGTRGGVYGEELIKDKWVVHTSSEREGNPNYYGCIRLLGGYFIRRRWIDQFYLHYLEKYGQPHIHAKCDDNASLEVMNEIQAIIDRGSYDHNIVTKGNTGLEIVQPSSTASVDGFERYLALTDKLMSQYMLGTSDLTDPGVHGSQAAVGQRADSVSNPKRDRDARNLWDTIRSQLFEPIVRFNSHLFTGTPRIPVYREIFGDEQVTQSGNNTTSGAKMSKQAESITGKTVSYAEYSPVENPYQIKATEAVASFRDTETFKTELFKALFKKLEDAGIDPDKIAAAKEKLQNLTLDAIENGKPAAEVADAIVKDKAFTDIGIGPADLDYLTQATQLHKDMAYSGAQWDQAVALQEEQGKQLYWQYHTLEDGLVRPTHAPLDEAVFKVGNEDTDRLLPPIDYRCRCYWTTEEEVPDGATLYEVVPPEFEAAINEDFSW